MNHTPAPVTLGQASGELLIARARVGDPLTLPLAEVFGPTFQGEGPHLGRVARFVRLGRCNLTCSWCDTPQTWDYDRYDVEAECPETAVDRILTDAAAIPAPLTVVTGGEPLIHQRKGGFEYLLTMLNQLGEVHVETNGTIPPLHPALVNHFTVSPKLANSGETYARRVKPAALAQFLRIPDQYGATVAFKFVCRAPEDLVEVDGLVDQFRISRDQVWIMPEGTTADELVDRHRALVDAVLQRGYGTTTRLHTLLWPNERRGR